MCCVSSVHSDWFSPFSSFHCSRMSTVPSIRREIKQTYIIQHNAVFYMISIYTSWKKGKSNLTKKEVVCNEQLPSLVSENFQHSAHWWFLRNWAIYYIEAPNTAATRSKAWTAFARSKSGIVDSNPSQGMDVCVCVYSLFVLSFVKVAALRRAHPPSKESYRLCKKDYETEEEVRPNKGV
jgi:hypothetical protein